MFNLSRISTPYLRPQDGQKSFLAACDMSTATSQPTPNFFQHSEILGGFHGFPSHFVTFATGDWNLTISTAASKANSLEELDNSLEGILTETTESDSPFTDSSSTLFSLYLSHAEKYDKDQAESWKAGADGILVFVRKISSYFSGFMGGN